MEKILHSDFIPNWKRCPTCHNFELDIFTNSRVDSDLAFAIKSFMYRRKLMGNASFRHFHATGHPPIRPLSATLVTSILCDLRNYHEVIRAIIYVTGIRAPLTIRINNASEMICHPAPLFSDLQGSFVVDCT
jgi:hypothetical protein